MALCLVLARAQGQTVTPQRPLWCQQWQQIRCQCCESWWAHSLPRHPWDMLGVTGETEAGEACDLHHYPEKGFGRTTRPSWLWGKMGHSFQQGIARARPCPRAQMGPWAGVGHICGCTRMCSQDLPTQPCPRCVSTCAASTRAHTRDLPARGTKGPSRALERGGALLGTGAQGAGWGLLGVSCAPRQGVGCRVLGCNWGHSVLTGIGLLHTGLEWGHPVLALLEVQCHTGLEYPGLG